MKCSRRSFIWTLGLSAIAVPTHRLISQTDENEFTHKQKENNHKPVDVARLHNSVLWRDPGAIASLDLFYGQGGKESQPAPPFKFESEDLNGTSPKFDARDANGTKWRVKLGGEARPEVVASRFLWAVGYFVEDDYVLPSAQVENLHIRRGAKLAINGQITDARFARKPEGETKIGTWQWKKNPFVGTKEFNGLRVMMAVMNNWDLKDVNNAVFEDKKSGRDIFLASDIGATFASNGISFSERRSTGNVKTYEKSKFIKHRTEAEVDFATPAVPDPVIAPNLPEYIRRLKLEWIGKRIPIADARWIGSLLRQLRHEQLMDAYRAGRFPQEAIEKYVRVVEGRIKDLAAL